MRKNLFISSFNVLISIALVLALLFVPSYLFTNVICGGFSVMKRDKRFYQSIDKTKVLVLGDSHNMKVLKTGTYDGIFNLATGGENYTQTYYKLKHILSMPSNKVELVVLPLNLNSFAYHNYSKKAHLYYWARYINYVELGLIQGDLISAITEYIHGKFFPYIGKMDMISKYIKKGKPIDEEAKLRLIEARNKKFSELDSEERNEVAEERVGQLFPKGFKDDTIEVYFDKLIELCKSNNVEIVLLTLPFTKEFTDSFSQKYDINLFEAKVAEVKERYPNLNYLDFTSKINSNDFFVDSDHLSLEGTDFINSLLKPTKPLNKYMLK